MMLDKVMISPKNIMPRKLAYTGAIYPLTDVKIAPSRWIKIPRMSVPSPDARNPTPTKPMTVVVEGIALGAKAINVGSAMMLPIMKAEAVIDKGGIRSIDCR